MQSFCGSDFNSVLFSTHLEIFSHVFYESEKVSFSDILAFFVVVLAKSHLIPQVGKLLMLLLVMPATNVESERSFSALRRIKSYLRTTMSQQRLNHLMILHVHHSETDNLDLVQVANDFIDGYDHRKKLFEIEFKQRDLLN